MGGCASKPKDLGTRKLPSPAVRKPHAPPEVPVQSPEAAAAETVAQEKKDGDENKETTTSVDVCEPAPKMKEPETSEAKPVNEEGVAVEVRPREAKVEPPKEEKKENIATKEEEKEVRESVAVKEIAGTEAPKEKKEEVETHVVPKEEKKEEVAEKVAPKQEKEA